MKFWDMHPSHLLRDYQLSISSMLNTLVAVPKRKGKGYDPIGSFCLIICKLFSFCSLGLGIPITALFSCDGKWMNTRPENNPLSMEDTNYFMSFHERSSHTKRIFIWSFRGGTCKFTWYGRVILHIGRYGGLIWNNFGFRVFGVCLVWERSGTEWHGSIPLEWVGSIIVFCRSNFKEWNDSF